MKTWLITGSCGFIGFSLIHSILNNSLLNDIYVVGVDNMNNYYEPKLKHARLELLKNNSRFKFFNIDIANKGELDKICEEFKFDIIIHLAAQAGVRYSIENPQAYLESNLIGFFNMLELCKKIKIKKFIFASSSSVYGASHKSSFSVNDKTDSPISLYAATKKSNEVMAHSYSHLYSIPMIALRFFTVYGPWGRPDMAYFEFTDKIFHGKEIKVFNQGNMLRDFTYIDDVISGIIACTKNQKEPYKIYNIGNNKPTNLLEFISIIEEKLGKKAKKVFYPIQPGDVYKTFADISESELDLGFKPKISIHEGLFNFVDWYKNVYLNLINKG